MRFAATVLIALTVTVMPAAALAQEATPSPNPSPTANCPYVEFSIDRTSIAAGQTVTFTARRVKGAADQRVGARLTRLQPEPRAILAEDNSNEATVAFPVTLNETTRIEAATIRHESNCLPLGRPDSQVFLITVTSTSPSPQPSRPMQTPVLDCAPVMDQPAGPFPAWGMDGKGGATITVARTHPHEPERPITLWGYKRPTTDLTYRPLAATTTDENGQATFALPLTGNARVSAFGGGCVFQSGSVVVNVQDRIGPILARRVSPRRYTFEGFWAGPTGKVLNLYRVDAAGHTILTAQTRSGREFYRFERTFLQSGQFTIYVSTGTDINSVGDRSAARPTIVH